MFQLALKRDEREFLKSLEILDEMDSEDTNIYAPSMIDRFENRPDNLDDMCFRFYCELYLRKSRCELSKMILMKKPIAEIHEEEDLKTAITIKLKNGFGKTAKKNSVNCDRISHY